MSDIKNDVDFSVSVIIPVFNGEKYIAQAVESVLTQQFKPLEIIVIDDGSEDNSYGSLKPFMKYIKYFKYERKGTGHSRNRGIGISKGEFIAHLDHDDIWEQDKLLQQVRFFSENKAVEIVGTLMSSFYSSELDPVEMNRVYCPPEPIPSFSASAILVKRSVYSDVGLYKSGTCNTPDLEWFIRVRESGVREGMVNKVLCHRRLHLSNTGRKNSETNNNRLLLLKEKIDRGRRSGK